MKPRTYHHGHLQAAIAGIVAVLVLVSCSSTPEHKPGPLALTMEKPHGSVGDLTTGDYHKGVSLVSRSSDVLARPESDQTIEGFSSMGVTSVSLVVAWYQATAESEKIAAVPSQTVRDEALVHAINEAHRNGLKVMLKPHVDCLDGTFRGEIRPSEAWFASYREFILHYARLAETYHVSLLCVGTELENTSIQGWLPEWSRIIDEVRAVYKGKLTYAANWTEYGTVSFWDKIDFVGIDAYFPVTQKFDPSQEEIDGGWAQIAEKLAAWRTEQGISKPVIFTEIGYQSADGSNVTPWQTTSRKEDQEEQAMVLEGMFRAMEHREWFKGIYWWNYFPREAWKPLDFTIKGKKAEEVLRRWYEKEKSS